jgi:hypothetical protein
MTPRMRELLERCLENNGECTRKFLKTEDKWRMSHLKKQGWVVTWPDDDGNTRVRVLREWPARRAGAQQRRISRRRRESGATGP